MRKKPALSPQKEFGSKYPIGTELIPSTPYSIPIISRMIRDQLRDLIGMNHPPIDMSELRFFATTTVLGPGKGGYPIVHGVKCEYEGRFYAFDIAQDFFRPLHRQKNKKSTS